MKTKSSFFLYLFGIIGFILLGVALYLYLDKQAFLDKAEISQGKVIELLRTKSDNSISYRPVVEYITKKGIKIEFSSSLSSNPASYNVGENVPVLYDPINPNKAEINGFKALYLGPLIVGTIGIVFFLIGFMAIRSSYLKQKESKYLLNNGKRIITKFENVQHNKSTESSGRNPFQIYSQWLNPNTNEIYIFKSDDIWFDPTDFIKSEEIKVLINPDNPKQYIMDTSFLPNLKN